MAQLDFFFTPDQVENIVIKFLLREGFSFIPSLLYTENKIRIVRELSELRIIMESERHFYLTHPNITIYDFILRKIYKEGSEYYFILDKYGGPYLELFLPKRFMKDSDIYFNAGFIAMASKYYHDIGNLELLNNKATKEMYENICKYIKKNTNLIKSPINRSYRISEEVINELNNGAKINDF